MCALKPLMHLPLPLHFLQWEAWAAQLCNDKAAAGPALAAAIAKGGAEAARAFNATIYLCNDTTFLFMQFANYINPPYVAQFESVAE